MTGALRVLGEYDKERTEVPPGARVNVEGVTERDLSPSLSSLPPQEVIRTAAARVSIAKNLAFIMVLWY
jgi:hypothetical protein